MNYLISLTCMHRMKLDTIAVFKKRVTQIRITTGELIKCA